MGRLHHPILLSMSSREQTDVAAGAPRRETSCGEVSQPHFSSPTPLQEQLWDIFSPGASTLEAVRAMDGAAATPLAHGLQRVAERAPDGQPMLEDEELARSFQGVSLVLGDGRDLGAGSLFITTRCGFLGVLWQAVHLLQLLTDPLIAGGSSG